MALRDLLVFAGHVCLLVLPPPPVRAYPLHPRFRSPPPGAIVDDEFADLLYCDESFLVYDPPDISPAEGEQRAAQGFQNLKSFWWGKSPRVYSATLRSDSGINYGSITLTQLGPKSAVLVSGVLTGLQEGEHSLAIHEGGDGSNGCGGLGLHFNPHDVFHGDHAAQNKRERHVGDLGNVLAPAGGRTLVAKTDRLIQLFGANNVLGRSIAVYSAADDLGKGKEAISKINGNAGTIVACGTIGLVIT